MSVPTTNSYYFYRKAHERYVHLLNALTANSESYKKAYDKAFNKYQGASEVCSPELVASNPEVEQKINKLFEKQGKLLTKGTNLMIMVGRLIMTANPNNPYFGAKDYEAVMDYLKNKRKEAPTTS